MTASGKGNKDVLEVCQGTKIAQQEKGDTENNGLNKAFQNADIKTFPFLSRKCLFLDKTN